MKEKVILKQINFQVSIDDWKLIRNEAARRKIPVTNLCRELIEPLLDKLKKQQADR